MIDYSVVARPNPREKEMPHKYYACAQVSETVSMTDFCRHIASHGSVYSRADIMSVLTQTVDCIREICWTARRLNSEI